MIRNIKTKNVCNIIKVSKYIQIDKCTHYNQNIYLSVFYFFYILMNLIKWMMHPNTYCFALYINTYFDNDMEWYNIDGQMIF
jgi:hypothetical protein